MNTYHRLKQVSGLLNTSVDDLKITLSNGNCDDPQLLCDLLIRCRERDNKSREHAVRARISKLIKGKK